MTTLVERVGQTTESSLVHREALEVFDLRPENSWSHVSLVVIFTFMLRRTLKTLLGNPWACTSGANVQQLGAAFARAASSFLDKKSVTERVVKV